MNLRFVLTGGPGTGKTTLLDGLRERGHPCVPESGRAVIQQRKAAGLSPRPALDAFGWEMLRIDVAQYRSRADTDGPTFFDRSVLDSLAYLDQRGRISPAQVDEHLARYPYNAHVFVAPPWPEIFCNDADRDQTFAESTEIDVVLRAWYEKCGYQIVELPKASTADRAEFVAYHVAQRQAG